MKESISMLEMGFQSSSGLTPEFAMFYRIFKQEFTRLQAQAPQIAQRIWECAEPVSDHHPYFEFLDINHYPLREYAGQLIVPLYDERGVLCDLRILSNHGSLAVQLGGGIEGSYHLLGEPDGIIYIAVGFPSAAKIHELMGTAVAVAFSDSNLPPVAEVIRKQYPDIKRFIAGNANREEYDQCSIHAYEAAVKTDCLVTIPDFSYGRVLSSFWDLVRMEGPEAARKLLSAPAAPPKDWDKPVWDPF